MDTTLRDAIGQALHDEIHKHGGNESDWHDSREIDRLADAAMGVLIISMILHCPACGLQHVDAPDGDWANPPHRSHLCHGCGRIWRPADVPTMGVAAIQTKGANDSPLAAAVTITGSCPNGYRMTTKATAYGSYAAFIDSGWTDAQLIEHGYMELNSSTGLRCPNCHAPKGAVHTKGCVLSAP